MELKIGLLDFGYRNSTSPTEILHDVIQYAARADELGFSCFWLSEHHNSGTAWSTPEILLPVIAGMTENIKVGMAGVLLSAHSPYRIALTYKLLANLFPDRVDLGLANGNIQPDIARRLLDMDNEGAAYTNRFQQKVDELLYYLRNEKDLYDEKKLRIPPVGGLTPRIWKLSSSFSGLHKCVDAKMNVCRSLFHGKQSADYTSDRKAIMQYQELYYQTHKDHADISLALCGACARTDRSARAAAQSLDYTHFNLSEHSVIGQVAQFREKFCELHEKYGISQFIFYDMAGDPKQRLAGLELLASEFF